MIATSGHLRIVIFRMITQGMVLVYDICHKKAGFKGPRVPGLPFRCLSLFACYFGNAFVGYVYEFF